ncbi:flagellar hook capping FlgD N-terminal domain-containing protein [Antarctobacter jejuensis]|uniref:flagellar hook capping FlgD N-terminal domain-containing protein n=1 Tax=Antarctobacter jejuensis TaxID=1439938 RepID=UPI003FCFEEF6
MTDISTTPPLYGGQSAQSSAVTGNPEVAEAKAALSSDFDTFLKMLTVQVQNQDPLNPVDSTDYATQLATFSSVEQQVLTNDLLSAMSAALGGNAMQELSGWIGMDALVQAPVSFYGDPIAIRPGFAEEADAAQLIVRNSNGDVVQKFALDLDQEEVFWSGTDDTGAALPFDTYRFDVQSFAVDEVIDTRQAQAFTRIQEVRKDGDSVVLRLAGGTETDPANIEGLRHPGFQ